MQQLYCIYWWALLVFGCMFRMSYIYHHVICEQWQFHFFSSLDPLSFLLIAVTRTSKSVLNKSDEGRYFWFVYDLRGKPFSFSPLRMMLAVGLSYMAFILLRLIPFMPNSWRNFIINGCWFLLFLHLLRWPYSFYSSGCWCGITHRF